MRELYSQTSFYFVASGEFTSHFLEDSGIGNRT